MDLKMAAKDIIAETVTKIPQTFAKFVPKLQLGELEGSGTIVAIDQDGDILQMDKSFYKAKEQLLKDNENFEPKPSLLIASGTEKSPLLKAIADGINGKKDY